MTIYSYRTFSCTFLVSVTLQTLISFALRTYVQRTAVVICVILFQPITQLCTDAFSYISSDNVKYI
jgi:hypothetical protein